MKIEQVSIVDSEGLDTNEVIHTFNNSDDLAEIRDCVRNAKDRLFIGWGSVDGIDKDNEKIPIDEIIEHHKTLLDRGGALNDMHSNHQIGRLLAYRTMVNPKSNTVGVLQLNKVYSNYELDDKVWSEIKSGERTGLSVGGYNMTPRIEEKDGKLFKVLAGFRHTETSSVFSPANPLALNEAVSMVAKSEKLNNKYFVMEGEVYKVEKVGEAIEGALESQSSVKVEPTQEVAKSEANVLNQNNEELDTMTQEDVSKADILGVAIQKMDAGETLSEEEKSALKSAATAKKSYESKDEKDVEKQDKEEKDEKEVEKGDDAEAISSNGKSQPEDTRPEEANQEDVAKSITNAVLKAVDAKFAELSKSLKTQEIAKGEKVASTPAPEQGADVAKSSAESKPSFSPAEIAKGSTKMSWSQLNNEVKKMTRGQ